MYVYPPKYRISLECTSIKAKKTFISKLREIVPIFRRSHIKKPPTSFGLRVMDDSNILKKDYIIFLTPPLGNKEYGVNHVMSQIYHELKKEKIKKADIEVLLAGDSYSDITMLFYGALGTNATAILVGGSRLTNIFMHKKQHDYAGESLFLIKENLLTLKGKPGYYTFSEKFKFAIPLRNVVIGDWAYPKTKGPETILAYLNHRV